MVIFEICQSLKLPETKCGCPVVIKGTIICKSNCVDQQQQNRSFKEKVSWTLLSWRLPPEGTLAFVEHHSRAITHFPVPPPNLRKQQSKAENKHQQYIFFHVILLDIFSFVLFLFASYKSTLKTAEEMSHASFSSLVERDR